MDAKKVYLTRDTFWKENVALLHYSVITKQPDLSCWNRRRHLAVSSLVMLAEYQRLVVGLCHLKITSSKKGNL